MAARKKLDLLTAVEQIVEKQRVRGLVVTFIVRLTNILNMWLKRWNSPRSRV